MRKARYIMIGGFLGAGKTTALAALARKLSAEGLRVGLITNDQGQNLVDTGLLRSQGFATEEIAGGCFCCRFDSLLAAVTKLAQTSTTTGNPPDVFIAEPVGSCTDLVATVTYPLRRLYGDAFAVAPVSVLVDPLRALRVFGLETGRTFSDKVLYIYRKQLEEADLVVISKCDLLDTARLESLKAALATNFPGKEILTVSVRNGINLDPWFARLAEQTQSGGPAIALDYTAYGQGEALLGWLNATLRLTAGQPFDGDAFLAQFTAALQQRFRTAGAEIAHLKISLCPDGGLGELGVVNLVRSDLIPELSRKLEEPVQSAQLIVNLRAEAPPDVLAAALHQALPSVTAGFPTLRAAIEHLEQFRPGMPLPTHRLQSANG